MVRVKTSVTLPKQLLTRLEEEARENRDIEIINRNAKRLNREAIDTLKYQQVP